MTQKAAPAVKFLLNAGAVLLLLKKTLQGEPYANDY